MQYVRDMVNGNNGYQPYNFEAPNLKADCRQLYLGTMWEPIGTLKEAVHDRKRKCHFTTFSGVLDATEKVSAANETVVWLCTQSNCQKSEYFGSKIKGMD